MMAPIGVLIASAKQDDHSYLGALCRSRGWRTFHAKTYATANEMLMQFHPEILITDQFLPGGGWRQLASELGQSPHSPVLIVTSRAADDRLWAEVLNLGGHDVLPSPYLDSEAKLVIDSAHDAWLRARELSAWRERLQEANKMAAAQ